MTEFISIAHHQKVNILTRISCSQLTSPQLLNSKPNHRSIHGVRSQGVRNHGIQVRGGRHGGVHDDRGVRDGTCGDRGVHGTGVRSNHGHRHQLQPPSFRSNGRSIRGGVRRSHDDRSSHVRRPGGVCTCVRRTHSERRHQPQQQRWLQPRPRRPRRQKGKGRRLPVGAAYSKNEFIKTFAAPCLVLETYDELHGDGSEQARGRSRTEDPGCERARYTLRPGPRPWDRDAPERGTKRAARGVPTQMWATAFKCQPLRCEE